MIEDKRKILKASWPPRSVNPIQVQLNEEDYETLYNIAFETGDSLAETVRKIIRATKETNSGS